MDPQALARIERMNYLLSALVVAVSALLLPRSVALGLTVGAAVTCVNFSLIRRLVTRMVARAAEQRNATALLFIPKFTGLIVVVFLCIRYVPMSPVAFAVGFSIFLVSIAIESIRFAIAGTLSVR
jgi:hypothetical protein